MNVFGGWKAKRIYERNALRIVTRAAKLQCRIFEDDTCDIQSKRHCIVLHGWSLDAAAMSDLTTALRALPTARDWRFWDITYDTQWSSFSQSARKIGATLRESAADFEDVILIGYSMGGIVARQLVAEEFPCRALVTLCSPHHGAAPWWPAFGRGPRSIVRRSPSLRALNKNPRDQKMRAHYYFFAVDYDDRLGRHAHDGVVPRDSALGVHLGPVATRETIHLHYSSLATYDPHWRGKDPQYIQPALQTIAQLFDSRI